MTTLTKKQHLVLTNLLCGALMSPSGRLFVAGVRLYTTSPDMFAALRDAKYISVNGDGMYTITAAGRTALGQGATP